MEVKICACGASAESPTGVCRDCLKESARKFWEYVESFRPARLKEEARRKRTDLEPKT